MKVALHEKENIVQKVKNTRNRNIMRVSNDLYTLIISTIYQNLLVIAVIIGVNFHLWINSSVNLNIFPC